MITTEQEIEIKKGNELPIMEYFYSIQGEGYYSGRSAFFIRVAGCDVGCVWCDVKESWNKNEHEVLSVDFLLKQVKESGTNFVVITGGEPAMYDLTILTNKLKELGMHIAIETSGAYKLVGNFDWVCLSPKKFKAPIDSVVKQAHELKVIVFNSHDFKWGEEFANQVSTNCKLFLQPEWSKNEEMAKLIVDYVKETPKWNISLQTHKYLGVL